ncbi:MAG: tetratricopeptide repeat protein, partial [Anaerolineales bacterium]|nr:tetratricopeptide repeat protein [Anaerolineales bacterium]
DILEKELEMDPSPATFAVYQKVMERETQDQKPARVSEKGSRMVGRGSAWESLHQTWKETGKGTCLALIMGEAGIGKTYLAEEFTRWARKEGITTMVSHSYPAEGELAYTPLTEFLRSEPIKTKLKSLEKTWLVELSRLIPELELDFPDLPRPEQLTENWQRQRMFEASTRAMLAGENNLVLLLDDLQWCDPETLDWLRYLLEYDTQTRILILASVRIEDLTPDNPLIKLFTDLERSDRITEILLDRLDFESTRSLAANLWGDPLEEMDAIQLFRETEGNPLFVAEMVRAGFLKGEPDKRRLPPKVQAVIESRLNALSPTAREVAKIAAVVDRVFGFPLLLQAEGGEEEKLLEGLDELWGRRLIRDVGEEGYNFSHDKFREVIYQGLSPHRRKYYHHKVADALVIIHKNDLGEVASQLAIHYNQAGKADLAVDYYLLAGERARMLYARQNAIEYYRRAADLLGDQKDLRLIKIFQGWGDVLIKLTLYDESADAYQKMLTAAIRMQDCKSQAQSWLAIGTVRDRQGDHKSALDCAEKALALAQENDYSIEIVEAVLLKGQSHYRLGDAKEAGIYIQDALDLCHKDADQYTVSRCLSLMGLIQDDLGEFDLAREYKEQALAIIGEIEGDWIQGWRGTVTMNLANTATLRGDFNEAVNLYQQSLDIFQETKNQDMIIGCLANLAAAKAGLGEHQQAEEYLRQVLEITKNWDWMGKPITCFLLAEACLGQNKLDEALEAAKESLVHAELTGAQQAVGAACRVLGKVASRLKIEVEHDGKTLTPRECFQHSEKIYADLGADAERAHTLKAWAEHELGDGDNKEGEKMWEEAKGIFSRLNMGTEVEKMEE